MRRCTECDSYVSERFCRVFGPTGDELVVHACLECETMRAIQQGAAALPDDHDGFEPDR